MWRSTTIGSLGGIGILLAAAAHPAPPDSLSASLARYMAPYTAMRDFSGRVLIARGDSVLIDSAFTAPGDAPSTPATRFAIGSVTKTFTAAAIHALEQQGKLRLTDTVGHYVSGLGYGGQITIEQLLAHSAGVPDYYAAADYPRLRTQAISLEGFARWVGAKPLDFAPGTRSSYSNSGYALLAAVIEHASGQPYATFIRDAVLVPAHLASTGQLSDVRGSLAAGHNPGPPPALLQPPVPFDISWLTGSGSMYSTTGDLLKWARAHRAGAPLAFSSGATYPYGWHREVANGDTVLEQNGRIPSGYATELIYYPGRDLTIVVLSDIQSDAVTRIREDIVSMVLGRPYTTPTVRTSMALADSVARRYAGSYQIAPGLVLGVRTSHGGLELAGPDGDYLPLDALTDSTFFFRPLYVRVSFVRDSTGWNTLDWNGAFRAARVAAAARNGDAYY